MVWAGFFLGRCQAFSWWYECSVTLVYREKNTCTKKGKGVVEALSSFLKPFDGVCGVNASSPANACAHAPVWIKKALLYCCYELLLDTRS